MTRRSVAALMLALASSCWDENAVLDACVNSGRCLPPSRVDAGGPDGGADAGTADAGTADAGTADAGTDAGSGGSAQLKNGALCLTDVQCASGSCEGKFCAAWSARSSGAGAVDLTAMAALPTGGMLLGGTTLGNVTLGSEHFEGNRPTGFWLTVPSRTAVAGGVAASPHRVVEVAWVNGPWLLSSAAGGSELSNQDGAQATVLIAAESFTPFDGGWLLGGSASSRAALYAWPASTWTSFANEGTSTGNKVTRVVADRDGLVVAGAFITAQIEVYGTLLTRAGQGDAFVARQGSWVRAFTSSVGLEPTSVIPLPGGGALVGFKVQGSFAGGRFSFPTAMEQVVVARLTPLGELEWARAIRSSQATLLGAMALSSSDEVVVVGETASGLVFEDGGVVTGTPGANGSGYVAILSARSGEALAARLFSCSNGTSASEVKLVGVAFDSVTQGLLVGGQANCDFDLGGSDAGSTSRYAFWGNLGRWW